MGRWNIFIGNIEEKGIFRGNIEGEHEQIGAFPIDICKEQYFFVFVTFLMRFTKHGHIFVSLSSETM